MKRQRGRGRKPGNQNNRSFESNGPDVKVRGNAAHIHEKYLQLARDASSSGDRILAENYHQHAEHYFRIVQANQPKRDDDGQGGRSDNRNQDNRGQDGRDGGRGNDGRQQNNPGQNQNPQPQGNDGSNEDEGRSRRGRGRRPRRDDNPDQGGRNESAKDRDPLEVVNLDGDEGGQGDAKQNDAKPADAPDHSETPKRRSRSPRKPKVDADAQAALDTAGDGAGTGGSKQDDAA